MRVGPDANDSESKALTGWYRTGKVVAADDIDIQASLTLQKGLIFWTSVHMWPQLASKGKDAARFLQLGFMAPSMTMAAETDSALDEDEAEDVQVSERVSTQDVSSKDIGFRPDYNPKGFSYKRRESAAMKRKKSAIEEIVNP